MTRLEGVPETCPHCHRPTHGILYCACGRLTTERAKPDRQGYRERKAGGRSRDSSPKAVARRRAKLAGA
jgi:hypothetical protein